MPTKKSSKPSLFQPSLPSSPSLSPEPSLPSPESEEELEVILKERTAELKEAEERKKEETKKAREVEIAKRKEEGAEHTARVRKIQIRKKTRHGKKYQAVIGDLDRQKLYSVAEAVNLVKKLSTAKFDASLDLHINVLADNARGIVNLPHGSGKVKKVAVASDALIEEITAGKLNFDVLVASPAFMPKLAKVARILGPKGLMPTPKSGTIFDDPESLKKEIESGKIEFRADKDHVIHLSIGRVSWGDEKLIENLKLILQALVSQKIKSAHLAPTMGPSLKLKIE